jgi:GH43 family beta-xylosidase
MFTNPLTTENSADPAVIYHDGFYYAVVCAGDRGCALDVMKAKKLQDVFKADPVRVYTSNKKGPLAFDHWAPELWYIGGSWYIYTCATDGINNFTHRVIVLKGASQNPQDSFEFVCQLPLGDFYSIDSSILHAPNGKMYLLWSASNEKGIDNPCQMYMAEMESPVKMKNPGERLLIKDNDYNWEFTVIEGPACLVKNGVVSVVYSANAFDTVNYCLGLMVCRNANDPDFRNWKWEVSPEPVFKATEKVWGPGHNTFTVSPDGTETWIVYHSKAIREKDAYRCPSAQKINWENDVPVLGVPVDPGVPIEEPSITILYERNRFL